MSAKCQNYLQFVSSRFTTKRKCDISLFHYEKKQMEKTRETNQQNIPSNFVNGSKILKKSADFTKNSHFVSTLHLTNKADSAPVKSSRSSAMTHTRVSDLYPHHVLICMVLMNFHFNPQTSQCSSSSIFCYLPASSPVVFYGVVA